MTTPVRLAILGAAAVIAVVAFLVLRPGEDEPQRAADNGAASPAAAEPDPSEDEATDQGSTQETSPTSAEEDRPTTIRVRDGAPVGGVKEVRAEKGDTVRLRVISDQADAAHLHGYDIEKEVGPGTAASFRFEADAEGIFELELHGSGTQIGSLRVEP